MSAFDNLRIALGQLTKDERRMVAYLSDVHDKSVCEGKPCIIHAPLKHHMRKWPLLWRGDLGLLERICSHGVGHPDPSQFWFWDSIGQKHKKTHGCDGCCAP